MVQRDYILRIIEQFGMMLIALRNRILGGAVDEAEVEDELAGLAGRAGLDMELLRGFSEDSLYMFATGGGELEPGRCWLMAELLYLDGLHAGQTARPREAAASLTKARMLYTLLEPGGGMLVGFPEAAERIEEIDALLAAGAAPGP